MTAHPVRRFPGPTSFDSHRGAEALRVRGAAWVRGGRREPARPSGRARSREPVTSSSSQPSSSCPSSSQPSSWPCENHLLELNGLLVGSPSPSLATNCSRCASFVAHLATRSRVRRPKVRHSRLRATRAPRRRCERSCACEHDGCRDHFTRDVRQRHPQWRCGEPLQLSTNWLVTRDAARKRLRTRAMLRGVQIVVSAKSVDTHARAKVRRRRARRVTHARSTVRSLVSSMRRRRSFSIRP